MRIQGLSRRLPAALSIILALLLAAFLAAPPRAAAQARLNQVSDQLLEITGGTGAGAWRLRYTTQQFYPMNTDRGIAPALLALAEGDRAWFSHAGWLRLIDTRRGVVIGRWQFPGRITRLSPAGAQVELDFVNEDPPNVFTRTPTFDPSAPTIPYWPVGHLLLYRFPNNEPSWAWPLLRTVGETGLGKPVSERVRTALPELEEAIRRDPLSPWFRVSLGKLFLDIGDSRSTAMFEDAIRLPSTDFTELFPIASYLEEWGQQELARAAFERGYRDFLQRGSDPRLNSALIGKLILYRNPRFEDADVSEHRAEIIERNYRISPYGEAAELAWQLYAQYLERRGPAEQARLWRERAEDAKQNSTFGLRGVIVVRTDRVILLAGAAVLSIFLYVLILYGRYGSQRRFDLAALRQSREKARGFRFFNLEYWDRAERVALFTIVLVGWGAIGLSAVYLRAILRVAAAPISIGMGNLAGPVSLSYLQNRLPATSERDLILALAYQQGGENEKAESLYRRVPQFAEAWNNLGVLLKNAGKEAEARQAFERALQLDPDLAEAALNLGRPPGSLWTEQYQKILPGRPMLAPPRGEYFARAYLGLTPVEVFLESARGPGAIIWENIRLEHFIGGDFTGAFQRIVIFLFMVSLVAAFAMTFVIPARQVTQPPGPLQLVWEILFPGTSRVWRLFGGLVFLAWQYSVALQLLTFWIGTPSFIAFIATPNVATAYAVPALRADVLRLITPAWPWLYLAPALLFLLNLFLVLRARRRLAG